MDKIKNNTEILIYIINTLNTYHSDPLASDPD